MLGLGITLFLAQILIILGKPLLIGTITFFGNVYARKISLIARLRGTHAHLQKFLRSLFHQKLEKELQFDHLMIITLDKEELLWRAKSRLDRIGEGGQEHKIFS